MSSHAEIHPLLRLALVPARPDIPPPDGFPLMAELAETEGWALGWGPNPDAALTLILGPADQHAPFTRALTRPGSVDSADGEPGDNTAALLGQWSKVSAVLHGAARPLFGPLAELAASELRQALYRDAVVGLRDSLEQRPGLRPRWGAAAVGAALLTAQALNGGVRASRRTWRLGDSLDAAVALVEHADLMPSGPLQRCAEELLLALNNVWGQLEPGERQALRRRLRELGASLPAHATLGGEHEEPGPAPTSLVAYDTWNEPVRFVDTDAGAGVVRWAVASGPELEPMLSLWARGLLTEETP